jgi:hypothetical protein
MLSQDLLRVPAMVLAADRSIRFCGVIDKLGYIINKKFRGDIVEPILSEEDNERYALLTTMRRRPNLPWREKIGKTQYFLIRSEKLVQATIPLTPDHLLLVYFDSKQDSNYDKIIIEKILPLVREYI